MWQCNNLVYQENFPAAVSPSPVSAVVQTMVTSHLGDCRSLQTALPSGIRMVHPCPSPHANIICSERSSLTTRISVAALTPHLCSFCPLFAIYFFITFWYIICFTYSIVYCLCLPSRRKTPWGWDFCPFIYCLKESLAQEVHRQYLWNEWQEERSSQGLSLWAQSWTWMMALPSSFLSCPYVPHPSVYLGSPGLDLEYAFVPGFQSQSPLFTGIMCPRTHRSGRAGLGTLIFSLGSHHCPSDLSVLDTAQCGLSLLALVCTLYMCFLGLDSWYSSQGDFPWNMHLYLVLWPLSTTLALPGVSNLHAPSPWTTQSGLSCHWPNPGHGRCFWGKAWNKLFHLYLWKSFHGLVSLFFHPK